MATSGPDSAATGKKRIVGVFGGSFDPVHNGHLRVALDAREQLGLDEVRLIPLAHAVHRDQPATPPQLRLEMLRTALAGRDDLVCDDREIRREGPSYTVDTLASLRCDFPAAALCLLLGEDAFASFEKWHDPVGILAIANIAVLQRPGEPPPRVPAHQQLLDGRETEILNPLRSGQICFCPVTQLDIASSDIRRRLAAGRSADFLLPPPVIDLIHRHQLYRQSE